MSQKLRTALGLLGTLALAALAYPDVVNALPAGVAAGLAGAVGLALHLMNADAPALPPAAK